METENKQAAIESMLEKLEGVADSVMVGLKLGSIKGTTPYLSSYSDTAYIPTESKNVLVSIDADGTMRLSITGTHKDVNLYTQFAREALESKAKELDDESGVLKGQADAIREKIKNLPTEEDEK